MITLNILIYGLSFYSLFDLFSCSYHPFYRLHFKMQYLSHGFVIFSEILSICSFYSCIPYGVFYFPKGVKRLAGRDPLIHSAHRGVNSDWILLGPAVPMWFPVDIHALAGLVMSRPLVWFWAPWQMKNQDRGGSREMKVKK